MTREETIATLKANYPDACFEQLRNALDMAIKALEQPEEDKLKKIADALSEKMSYMNMCPNERDIILGYLEVKRPNTNHCNTDCWNEECKSYHYETRKQPEHIADGGKMDCISRQAAIDVVHKIIYGFFDLANDDSEEPISDKDELLLEVNKAICNGIKALPSVQPEQRWISCSERMPDVAQRVLLSGHGQVMVGMLHSFGKYSLEPTGLSYAYPKDDIEAWMPLPEPYSERRKEGEK